ncbi:PEBP-like protein [Amylostereum chailletii]|nr:PEBP-like protein [Amylostereum chailletii]
MLPLRRLRPSLARSLTRSNTTTATTPPPAEVTSAAAAPPPAPSTASPPSTPAPETQKTNGRSRYPTHRPSINLDRPREWHRPVAYGVLPAYDLALRVIEHDAKAVQAEAAELKDKLDKGLVEESDRASALERLEILEVMSKVNLPDVRWKAANGMADLSQPVYRRLVEQRWRKEGALDLLMERLHQMHVIPDVLPDFHPSLDLRITVPSRPHNARLAPRHKAVEPGVFVSCDRTRKAPRLYTTVFHTDPRLYTLLMIDPDVPDESNAAFTTFVHWLQPNVTLPMSNQPLDLPTAHTSYIPPHPSRGTPYHRYVLLLLPQTTRIRVPQFTDEERLGFNVREFVEKYQLRTDGGGAHMWRAVWDQSSTKVWEEVLKKPMPNYGYIPKPDAYAEVKSKKRYTA